MAFFVLAAVTVLPVQMVDKGRNEIGSRSQIQQLPREIQRRSKRHVIALAIGARLISPSQLISAWRRMSLAHVVATFCVVAMRPVPEGLSGRPANPQPVAP
jgi:hypothetical protein